jgi:hypothetical protein
MCHADDAKIIFFFLFFWNVTVPRQKEEEEAKRVKTRENARISRACYFFPEKLSSPCRCC